MGYILVLFMFIICSPEQIPCNLIIHKTSLRSVFGLVFNKVSQILKANLVIFAIIDNKNYLL